MEGKLIIYALKGAAVGLAISLILLLGLSFVAMRSEDPDSLLSVLAYITQGIGAASAGFVTAKLGREKGLLTGSISGAFYAAIIVLGAIIGKGAFSFPAAIIVLLASAAVGGLFGIIGLPAEKSEASRRRDMMKRLSR